MLLAKSIGKTSNAGIEWKENSFFYAEVFSIEGGKKLLPLVGEVHLHGQKCRQEGRRILPPSLFIFFTPDGAAISTIKKHGQHRRKSDCFSLSFFPCIKQ
jgi:hypothetical protein